ncbi:sce7726 family protein [Archangium primigenium]|uniref:sce7726 family protein n=1 Tax=[Archangium] primigenium TaxID=2792470 RepID=UPI0019587757|nr:sce7726 family protein [Archangium primigenium]MBM7117623.1 sce7726 family protein [Archangium primigenium]
MHDADIRRALLGRLAALHAGVPDVVVREELGLEQGQCFVDVAVLAHALHGYELKSERDTLRRLPRQVEVYGAVLDKATLVVSATHLAAALPLLPSWWGVEVATTQQGGDVRLETVREPGANPQQQPRSVARLLWREEAQAILEALGAARGVRGRSREVLFARLLEVLSPPALTAAVCRSLRARTSWGPERAP